MPTVAGLFTSPGRKSGAATAHQSVTAIAGHGIEGCAHANPPQREVLFVSAEHLDELDLEPGVIRENVTVADADVERWPIGQRVQVGGAIFEITMVCDPCERMEAIRPGLRAALEGRRGMLARVVEGGDLSVGDGLSLL